MMRLSLMKKVLAGVGPEGSSDLAASLAEPWAPDAGTVRLIRASSNFLFSFTSGGRHLVLRFNSISERLRSAIDTELDFVEFLRGNGLRVPKTVYSFAGNRIERFDTPFGVFLATAFEFVPGSSPRADRLSEEELREWGRALSELHRVTAERPAENPAIDWSNFGRHDVGYLVSWAASVIADRTPGGIGREAHREYRHIVSWLDSFPRDAGIYGLIHFDFEPDNLVWHDGKPTILDFDDCAIGWRFADIAFAVRELFPDGRQADTGRYRLFMEGYGFQWNDAREIARLFPRFLRVHSFIMLGRLLRALDLEDDDPAETGEIVAVRHKLELAVEGYRRRLADSRVWTRRPARVPNRRAS